MRSHALLYLGLFASLTSTSAWGQVVWTVDDDGPADFATVQEAIDTAGEGDLVLVRPGAYFAAEIVGKGLSLVATGPATLTASELLIDPTQPALQIEDVPAGSTVHVRGFAFDQFLGTNLPTALIQNNVGALSIEDCTFEGDSHPMAILDCASVVFRGVTITASASVASGLDSTVSGPFDGVAADGSNLFFYDCEVTGGNGIGSGFGPFFPKPWASGDAGVGVRLGGGSLLASGCTITGGSGEENVGCDDGSSGGSAVLLLDGAQGVLQGNVLTPGIGFPGTCSNPDGTNGLDVEVDALSSALMYFNVARSGSVAAVAAVGATFQATLNGQPGDLAFVAISPGFGPGLSLPGGALAQHVQDGFNLIPLGTLDGSGEFTPSFTAPGLPVGVEAQAFHGQFLFFDGNQFHEAGLSVLNVVSPLL